MTEGNSEMLTNCLVCGKVEDGVRREVDEEAAWFQEVLKEVVGEDFEQFYTFCTICDRLVSEFEEISREKRSIKEEIQLRLSSNGANFEVIEYLNDNEDSNGQEITIETGEITDVSNFMKNEVKIFEIDVKSDVIANTIADEIKKENSSAKKPKLYKKSSKNEHIDSLHIEKKVNCEKILEVDSKTWNNIFLVHELSSNWNILLTCLLQKMFPDCLIHLEDPNYKSDSNLIFSARGYCQISSCTSKFSLRCIKNNELRINSEGIINHDYSKSQSDQMNNIFETDKSREKVYEMDETECEMARICQYCLKYFDDPHSFYDHRSMHIGDEDPFLCLSCGKTFATAKLRNVHYLEGHSKYKCDKCKKDFSSEVKLKMHVKHCTFGQTLQCKTCNKTFANKRNLRDHTKIFHQAEPIKEESKYHFPCTECDKVFYKKSNLTSHLLRHSDATPFICGVPNCGKGFKREKTLIKHFQLIHKGIKDEFLCVHCGQQFMSQTGLRAHISIHTGQDYVKRNVKCDACGKAFRCQADLKTHMVVHTKVKPYSCEWPQCGQSFSQKASLKDHLNVHEQKFQCEGCKKCFGRERYLMLHCKTCVHLSRSVEVVHNDTDHSIGIDNSEDINSIGVQHIIITTEGSELAGEIPEDVEMTQVQVVQSETGELAVTMLVAEDGLKHEGRLEVVREAAGEPAEYEIIGEIKNL